STTEILSELIPGAGLPVTASVAEALLFGILTDSQGFMTLNTTANSLRAAAALVEQGADMNNLYYQVLAKKSYEAVKYWGAGLASLKREDGIAWTELSIEDRQQANYPGRDDANLVNLLSRIDGVGVAIVFIEQDNEKVKVSWRAKKGFNVSEVAASFGGGGHVAAAGATIEGKLEEVQERVLSATKTAIF
ncbi:MAG: DHHA1 domain-containing protein, partial [Anaerolineae bacterium]|nr:DHHA1 domain-containing protein [Anaerolineae bacterium]